MANKSQALRHSSGQALVETAIILPLLVFILIGVFEVGWALRSYLILTNANREAARFAIRQNYLDFNPSTSSGRGSNNVGYEKVWTHTVESISNQIPFNESTGDMIISYLTVEATCTGSYTITTPIQVPTYTWKYPVTSTRQTLLDYDGLAREMVTEQVKYACANVESHKILLPNNMVVVEQWFRHRQLFGFPLISSPLTDPIEEYVSTSMRKAPDSRQ